MVSVQRDEHEPQRFWLAVLDGLRGTRAGSTRVRAVTPAPDPDTWVIVEGLLEDPASLDERVWLVIDDVHELHSDDALRQLELLLMRAPSELRFVLATRRDLRLGLHRLRLERELTEIRAADLRFTLDKARAPLEAAAVRLSESALALLHGRTEGWVAGLRLAAFSLPAHPDPEGFAAEFAGSERTVAEYLLAEVLERQPAEVRHLLLRTAILERVSGRLAEALTGSADAERMLQELEQANAFVASLDVRRSWFRYRHLFQICCSSSYAAPRRMSFPVCTEPRPTGLPSMEIRSRRSVTRRRRRTGFWPAACCGTPASTFSWTGEPRRPLGRRRGGAAAALACGGAGRGAAGASRHPRHRTAHVSLISEILNLLAGQEPAPRASEATPLREPLTESETRILRYLPTNLSVQEIAGDLYLSANTVKFHIRHLFAKLGAHQRSEAIERARALGLLAPSSRGR